MTELEIRGSFDRCQPTGVRAFNDIAVRLGLEPALDPHITAYVVLIDKLLDRIELLEEKINLSEDEDETQDL